MDEQFFLNYEVSFEKRKAFDVMLDILKKFIQVCKDNDLKYYAAAGTLLGAIRHKGFIPWDDDIDIFMHRKDFDKFSSIAPEAFCQPYFFQSFHTDRGLISFHARIRNSNTACINNTSLLYNNINRGIYISIFPLDGVVGISEANKQRKKIQKYKRLLHINRSLKKKKDSRLKSYFCKLASLFFILFNPKMIYGRTHKICLKHAIDDVNYVCCLVAPKYTTTRLFWHKELYSKTMEIDFEDIKITVPSGYDQILTIMYGDYMNPPQSISDMHSHAFILDAEKSYIYYKEHPELLENKDNRGKRKENQHH